MFIHKLYSKAEIDITVVEGEPLVAFTPMNPYKSPDQDEFDNVIIELPQYMTDSIKPGSPYVLKHIADMTLKNPSEANPSAANAPIGPSIKINMPSKKRKKVKKDSPKLPAQNKSKPSESSQQVSDIGV